MADEPFDAAEAERLKAELRATALDMKAHAKEELREFAATPEGHAVRGAIGFLRGPRTKARFFDYLTGLTGAVRKRIRSDE